MDWNAELEQVEKLIREAGALLMQVAAQPLDVLSAEGKDVKLQADRDSEGLILTALKAAGDRPILTEESGEHGTDFSGLHWVIDPLDGTYNYLRALPPYCVSIGLMEGDQARLGAIYDISRDELFTGIVGQGAWLNGRPIRVSGIADRAQAVLSTGFPSRTDYSDAALIPMVRQFQAFKKVRMIGAAAMSLAWVACGRMDAYQEQDVNLWDIAAGMAIVEAAGGHVEVTPSSRGRWSRGIRVAAHPALWAV